jgi:hypothetical protein
LDALLNAVSNIPQGAFAIHADLKRSLAANCPTLAAAFAEATAFGE